MKNDQTAWHLDDIGNLGVKGVENTSRKTANAKNTRHVENTVILEVDIRPLGKMWGMRRQNICLRI